MLKDFLKHADVDNRSLFELGQSSIEYGDQAWLQNDNGEFLFLEKTGDLVKGDKFYEFDRSSAASRKNTSWIDSSNKFSTVYRLTKISTEGNILYDNVVAPAGKDPKSGQPSLAVALVMDYSEFKYYTDNYKKSSLLQKILSVPKTMKLLFSSLASYDVLSDFQNVWKNGDIEDYNREETIEEIMNVYKAKSRLRQTKPYGFDL